ncbi:helix-turn-helix domain-containing protein [Methylobacterium sp. E-065]|uniref:helix-turn-helix domain-containing protein n=1 Tax=Methylobacterium sp. E-065 TaxID=2836583 RepID=UPI001FBBBCAC|nr:helix-turn-helix domain-containing protein [Methylobacterium sp. E-065]MCJ2016488.1 helix-turn-helix domain-containing protein [Methylobacterium sp. E-065]
MTRARPDIPAPGTPEAKARRAPRHDLSTLSEDQLRRRELVLKFGLAAYGSRWQTPLAEALGRLRRQDTAPVQIAAWVSGARPVPARVIPELEILAIDAASDLADRLCRIRAWPGDPAPTTSLEKALSGFPPHEPGDPLEEIVMDDER